MDVFTVNTLSNLSYKTSALKGFLIKSRAPKRRASVRFSLVVEAVRKMVFMSAIDGVSLIFDKASNPLIPGISMSKRSRSTSPDKSACMQDLPSEQIITLCPFGSKICLAVARFIASSSTTKIFFFSIS